MEQMPLDEFLQLLEKGATNFSRSIKQSGPFEIQATQFKEFAFIDLQNDELHGRVNALSNIKRGIECRIDEIFYNFCLYNKNEEENWNFPKKIEVLTELDIIAPRILTKINRQRNLLEHEYVNPSKDDLEDALDVAILFFGYTDRFMGAIFSLGKADAWDCEIDREKNRFELKINGDIKEISIDACDEWLEVAKHLVKKTMKVI